MRRCNPRAAADQMEADAERRLGRERAFNDALARENPCLRPTERYERGPLPPSDARFSTRADYLAYLLVRERGRYVQRIDYPTPTARRGCGCSPRGSAK